jgi:hypothetical protein
MAAIWNPAMIWIQKLPTQAIRRFIASKGLARFPAPDMTPEKAFPPHLADRSDLNPAVGIFYR